MGARLGLDSPTAQALRDRSRPGLTIIHGKTISRGIWLRIPTEAGRGYRFDVGRRSEMKPATLPN